MQKALYLFFKQKSVSYCFSAMEHSPIKKSPQFLYALISNLNPTAFSGAVTVVVYELHSPILFGKYLLLVRKGSFAASSLPASGKYT